MNPSLLNQDQSVADGTMSRREAIRRAAMLLGVAISPSLLSGVLQAQAGGGAGVGAKPVYLTARQFATAGAMAERILPRTDTPGALDVGVPAFIDLMYGRFLSEGERQTFATGLADVESASAASHRSDFATLPVEQQDSLLRKIASGSAREKTFFRQIKEVTVLGYFTSETVGKTVLHYDPVPGRFDACVPLSEVGNKAWTK